MCVCVFHTARRRLWSVCVQLVGVEGEEGGEPGARHCTDRRWTTACAAPHRCACVCVRWTRLVVVVRTPLEMRVAAQVCAGGGVYNPEANPEAAFR